MIKSIKMLVVIISAAGIVNAEVPMLINYPGKLTEKNGSPVTGTKSIKFAFFDAETAGAEKWSGTYSVEVTKGVFNVLLGSGASPFSPTLDFNANYWLQITVESEIMTPRQRISSVGYSIRSEYANRADTPMVISGCGDIDENVSEKVYFVLDKIPRSIKLYLYGEKFNEQSYTELAAHNHTASNQSSGHTHTVNHNHSIICEWGVSTRVYGVDEGNPKTNNYNLVQNANPTSSDVSSGHTHTVNSSGIVAQQISTSQKMYFNDLKVFKDGESIPNEITAAITSRASLSKLGDGTAGHVLNSTSGTGAINITDLFSTLGQHYLVFKQSGLNQGGRLRYYIYVSY
ncbi:MAG: hypothetical protein A2231_06705 [Candidatus Firestonebacteria bacterium RIFOXYA2_FULL_40_8]|nr:MAG: hypothetical protein A2231_06705 [Candidatus Firestonebacteria bacterium RIFOXYA2_FULL_40_8]